ncbi:uncharacterized protein RBU33_026839 isoform 1-T1 [Hipposideros larvatus]
METPGCCSVGPAECDAGKLGICCPRASLLQTRSNHPVGARGRAVDGGTRSAIMYLPVQALLSLPATCLDLLVWPPARCAMCFFQDLRKETGVSKETKLNLQKSPPLHSDQHRYPSTLRLPMGVHRANSFYYLELKTT